MSPQRHPGWESQPLNEGPPHDPAAANAASLSAPAHAARLGTSTVAFLTAAILSQVLALLLQRYAGSRTGTESVVWTWLDPYSLAGIACLALNGAVWPLVLRRMPLSRAYPFTAFIAPLELLAGATILDETIEIHHVVGIVFVVAAVWILAGRQR